MVEAGSRDPGSFLIFTLPITLPVLQSFFTFDDLENLSYYTKRPGQALWSNLVVFTSFRRPAGALFYLPSYWLFGLNPLPLYATGFSLFYLNLGLFYWLAVRLTGRRLTAALALVACAFHPHIYNVLFNFGAVYELLACASLLLGVLTYGYYRATGDRRLYWLTLGIYLVGLNAKGNGRGAAGSLVALRILVCPHFCLEEDGPYARTAFCCGHPLYTGEDSGSRGVLAH